MINADWVQLNCRVKPYLVQYSRLEDRQVISTVIESNVPRFRSDYVVKRMPLRTNLFDNIDYVYWKHAKIAEVCSGCNSPIMDADMILVRFTNEFLYSDRLYERVLRFLNDNCLTFKNWTRLDIACDFNFFLDAWGKKALDPATFIGWFMNDKARMLNARRGKKKFSIHGENTGDGVDLQTLSIGRKTSAVETCLYNKTEELKREDKPWIRDSWKQNSDIDLKEKVWRLEFKIHDFQTVVIDNDEFKMTLRTLEILKDENIGLLWNVLQEHYFQFYKPDKNKNVSRKKKIKLFDKEDTGMKLLEITGKELTTRKHKIFIKQLLEHQRKIRAQNEELKQVAWSTDYIAANIVYTHDLADWVKSRFPEWKYENYLEPPEVHIPVTQFSFDIHGEKKAEKHKFTY